MRLLRLFLVRERRTLMENDVRLRCIGRLAELPPPALRELRRTETLTEGNEGMLLRLALSYGSRSEIADGLRSFGEDVQSGRVDPASVDEETLRRYLYDPLTPDPDLLIRTAGEMRISNFLLWQISYAEIVVTDVCWPSFRRPELLDALSVFARRKRKFGGLLPDTSDRSSADPAGGKR